MGIFWVIMIAISIEGTSGIGGGVGGDGQGSTSAVLGDGEWIVWGVIGGALALPPGVRVLWEEAIERSIANDREAALAEKMGLSVGDYRAEMMQQEILSQVRYFGTAEEVSSIMEDLLEESPKRGVGFVRVHGSDTWLPRGLYERRQWVERQEARRPQRGVWPGYRPDRSGGYNSVWKRSARRRR